MESTMLNQIKALLAKKWKNEAATLEPGHHAVDEVLVIRVTGSVERKDDQLVAPTVSIPLLPTLALFWEKAGIARDDALAMLREALTEAMDDGVKEDANIQKRIEDVNAAVTAVRKDLISKLPKMHRNGKLLTNDLHVEVMPLSVLEPETAAA
jgi:hypothetical protein